MRRRGGRQGGGHEEDMAWHAGGNAAALSLAVTHNDFLPSRNAKVSWTETDAIKKRESSPVCVCVCVCVSVGAAVGEGVYVCVSM